ncbi:MAG: hypothetical protein ABIE22_00375 [archaeon]
MFAILGGILLKTLYEALKKEWFIFKEDTILSFNLIINNLIFQAIFFILLGILISYLSYKFYKRRQRRKQEKRQVNKAVEKEKRYIQEFLNTKLGRFDHSKLKSKLKELEEKYPLQKPLELKSKIKEIKNVLVEFEHKEEVNKMLDEKLSLKQEIEELRKERENNYGSFKKFNVSKKNGCSEEDSNIEKIQRKVNIRVDEDKRFFRVKNLNQDEIKYLLDESYFFYKRKSLVSEKIEVFLIKPRHNESIVHHFVVYDLSEYLESLGVEIMKFVTRKPDIVFTLNGVRYAIEIETGSAFSKVKNLKEKVKILNETYDQWFFVVTKREFVKKYKQIGSTVDLRYLPKKIKKLLKNSQK